jgi:hypothetical protein
MKMNAFRGYSYSPKLSSKSAHPKQYYFMVKQCLGKTQSPATVAVHRIDVVDNSSADIQQTNEADKNAIFVTSSFGLKTKVPGKTRATKKNSKKKKQNKTSKNRTKGKKQTANLKKNSKNKAKSKKGTKKKKTTKGGQTKMAATRACGHGDVVSKVKKFILYSTNYRQNARIQNFVAQCQTKRAKAATTFETTLSAVINATANGTRCSGTPSGKPDAEMSAVSTRLSNCARTVSSRCDVVLSEAENSLVTRCAVSLAKFLKDFKVKRF